MKVHGSVIKAKHEALFTFLDDYFNLEAYESLDESENALHLVDFAMEELFEEEYDFDYIKDVILQTESFLKMPIQEVNKSIYIKQHVGVEMIGLTPVEFLRFVFYRLKVEQWKKR